MNKHNCPRCNKELTLNNGQFYCKGENPYHIYYSTPEEAFNGMKSKIESSNLNVYTGKLTVDQFQKFSNNINNGQ